MLTRTRARRGIALVLTLSMLVLITILIVGLTTVMRMERGLAQQHLESKRAKALALSARDAAFVKLRNAISAGGGTGNIWASQPGKITVMNINQTNGAISVDTTIDGNLWSGPADLSTLTAAQKVNLNKATLAGNYPISGDGATMEVGWVEVGNDPTAPVSGSNPAVGRFAFWIDDEGTKVNINTADGTRRGTGLSDGIGQPTEVKLEAVGFDAALATAIAARQRSNPFVEPRGFLALAGATASDYEDNKFNLTHLSKSPELTFFGEPKIALVPTTEPGSWVGNLFTPAASFVAPTYWGSSEDLPTSYLGQIYPTSSQLPTFTYTPWNKLPSEPRTLASSAVSAPLPQFFKYVASTGPGTNDGGPSKPLMRSQRLGITDSMKPVSYTATSEPMFDPDSQEYAMGMRIAQLLKGESSQGVSVKWPAFASGGDSFGDKYTDRQIDSIVLQLLDIQNKGVLLGDTYSSVPYLLPRGFVSGKPVMGIARTPKITEVLLEVETIGGSPSPQFKVNQLTVEFCMPEQFGPGVTTSIAYASVALGDGMRTSVTTGANYDIQGYNVPDLKFSLGHPWRDNMWRVVNLFGQHCVDMDGEDRGTSTPKLEPTTKDRALATSIGRPTVTVKTETGPQAGGLHGTGRGKSLLAVWDPSQGGNANDLARLPSTDGLAQAFSQPWSPGEWRAISIRKDSTPVYMGVQANAGIKMEGGLSFWLSVRRNPESSGNWWSRWGILDAAPLDSLSGVAWLDGSTPSTPADLSQTLAAVIPFPPVASQTAVSVPGRMYYHWYVKDPLVNKFPGDWIFEQSSSLPSKVTLGQPNDGYYSSASDPEATWLPNQDPDKDTGTYDKLSQRFPSPGYLNYIRTGIMPDDETVPLSEQKGTPFRTLNFAPAGHASQASGKPGGQAYPDWAMLDLFTSPAGLHAGDEPNDKVWNLTSGGATSGRLNPNGFVEPFGIQRTIPLQAALDGLLIGQTTDRDFSSPSPNLGHRTGGTAVNASAVASAITSHLAGLGRGLIMPGELSAVPSIDSARNSVSGRNDLLRDLIGNLSTQSNVFSVYVIGQALNSGNVTGESRLRFIVERTLNLGVDGVPGNSADPGVDGVVGTSDDPADADYHPTFTYPLTNSAYYSYRILYAEDFAE